MKTVQYGDWKIAVDLEKTKEFYRDFQINHTQAHRNFAEYCKNFSAEEQAFFDSLGIDPVCCEIEHCGVSRKGEFPCGGYYLICGEFLEYPQEDFHVVEDAEDFLELEDEDLSDDTIYVGGFCFEFKPRDINRSDYIDYDAFNVPDGFILLAFYCAEMRWLLDEKPEEMMYEPPRFWEIHKKIREAIEVKREEKAGREETRKELESIFQSRNITFTPFTEKEIKKYRMDWLKTYAPADVSVRELRKICFQHRRASGFLWHIYSFEILGCEEGEKADNLFKTTDRKNCVFVSNLDDIAYKLEQAEALDRAALEEFCDWTITAADFSWTYSKTHEDDCGPYFHRRYAAEEQLLKNTLSLFPLTIDISDGELRSDNGFFSQNLSDAWHDAQDMNISKSKESDAMIWALFSFLHKKSRENFENGIFSVEANEADYEEILRIYLRAS